MTQKSRLNHTGTNSLNKALSDIIESAFAPLDEETSNRGLPGQLPYWNSETHSLIFAYKDQIEDLYCALPTENSLAIGLNGCCRVINWNAINEETFNELISGFVSLDILREIIDQNPYGSAIQGRVSGGSVGGVHGHAKTYKAFSGMDSVVHRIPLKLDNLPINKISFPIEGKYVLFSIDDFIGIVDEIDIPQFDVDENKLHLYVDRLRFGDIYFDLIKMRYLCSVVDECKTQYRTTNGEFVFALDANGIMHNIAVDNR